MKKPKRCYAWTPTDCIGPDVISRPGKGTFFVFWSKDRRDWWCQIDGYLNVRPITKDELCDKGFASDFRRRGYNEKLTDMANAMDNVLKTLGCPYVTG